MFDAPGAPEGTKLAISHEKVGWVDGLRILRPTWQCLRLTRTVLDTSRTVLIETAGLAVLQSCSGIE
ncbi:MAG: hypothetical protein M3410_08990 [Acidobacteriota bacterium]|nr:hypothetical protein [Acidobacteriota bacterium]